MFRLRSITRALALTAGMVALGAPAPAAELKISYTELSGILRSVLGDAKLHLHNKPGGILDMTAGSYFAIAGKQFDLPLPLKSFGVLGSTYAYYVDDLNSQQITAESIPGAVRLVLTFAPKATLAGTCLAGDCGLTNALPSITWRGGTISIDVVPVHLGLSLALEVRGVKIGGNFSANCLGSGVISKGACNLALGYARRTVTNLKPEIASKIKDQVNDAAAQTKVAEGLKSHLKVGEAGAFDITGVRTDSSVVRISFTLIEPAGG